MSYWQQFDHQSARARRRALRNMAEPPVEQPYVEQPAVDNPLYEAAGDPDQSAHQGDSRASMLEEVAAASQLLRSVGITVGGRDASEKPVNLGIKLPLFKGDPDRTGRFPPIAVQDFIDRVDGFFSSSAGQYATEKHKLQALVNAFPFGSPAATWWASVKNTVSTLDEFFELFKKQHGFDPRNSHYVTEKFNAFRQREGDNVVTYYTNFTTLVIEMHLVLTPDLVPTLAVQRSRFLSGLKPAVKILVMRTMMRHPDMTLNDIYFEALMEERQLPKPKPTAKINMLGNKKPKWRCAFCRTNSHAWDDCERIAQKKRDGTWEERPPRSKK